MTPEEERRYDRYVNTREREADRLVRQAMVSLVEAQAKYGAAQQAAEAGEWLSEAWRLQAKARAAAALAAEVNELAKADRD